MNIDSIQNGYVIDHIKAGHGMKVYEYFNTPKCLYIISELFTGGELFDKIKANQYLSEKVSVYLMKQLLSAVDFCHQNNIIHRDLKPENILIESEEEARKEFFTIKVIDLAIPSCQALLLSLIIT